MVSSQAATKYVSTTGSDSADGSIGTPWLTLHKGLQSIGGGDTLYIRGGTYQEAGFEIATGELPSGSSSAYTTIIAYPGETPLLKLDDGPSGDSYPFLRIPHTQPRQYIKLDGLTFDFSNLSSTGDRAGVDFRTIGNLTITNCVFTNAFAKTVNMLGLGHRHSDPPTGASNVVVRGCYFYQWNQGATTPTYDPHAIYAGILKDVTISENTFSSSSTLDINSSAIHLYDDGEGVAIGWNTGIVVERNYISVDDAGVFWWAPQGSGSHLRNNVIITSSTTRKNLQVAGANNTYVDNNTIYGGSTSIDVYTSGTSSGNNFRNNIVRVGGIYIWSGVEANTWANNTYNTFTDASGNQSASGGSTTAPSFVAAPLNLQLTAATGAGSDLSSLFTTDHLGRTWSTWGRGAYRFGGNVFYVSPSVTGTAGYGVLLSPWCITNAVTKLAANDLLNVPPGTYTNHLLISAKGTAGNQIVIQGFPGSIIDPAAYTVASWTRASSEYPSTPVYKLTSPPFEVGSVIVNGKNLEGFWKDPYLPTYFSEIGRANPYLVSDPAYDNGVSQNNYWNGLSGCWHHTNSSSSLYIRFADGSNPAGYNIKLGRLNGYTGTSPTDNRTPYASSILLNGAQYLTLRGLEIRGTRFPLAITHTDTTGSHHVIIESNYVHHGLCQILQAVNDTANPDYGGFISCSNNIIRYNVISEDRYLDSYGAWSAVDPAQTWPYNNAYGFNKMRYGRTVGGFGIQINGGAQTLIYGNTITNCNGGVLTTDSYSSSGPFEDLITITNNYFQDMSETAVSPQIGAKEMWVWDNYLKNVHYSFRLNSVGLPTAAYQRDWYIGFNRSETPIGRGDAIYVYAGVGPSTSTVRVWLYHNSFTGMQKAMHINATMAPYGLPYWRVINNIFSTQNGILDSNGGIFVSTPGIGIVENNAFRTTSTSPSWFGDTNVLTGTYTWSTNSFQGFTIDESSPAWEYGVDVSQTFRYYGVDYSALPGALSGYFSGSQPNSGWYQGASGSLPGQVSGPEPTDGETGVGASQTLSWSPASGATSYNVYFGSAYPPSSIGNQAGLSYDPGGLEPSTTYYWRIDSVNGNGTTTGPSWSFTTSASGSPTPMSGRNAYFSYVILGHNGDVTPETPPPTPSQDYDLVETWEGDVYHAWAVEGSADTNYMANPIVGSKSLRLDGGTATSEAYINLPYAYTNCGVFTQFRVDSYPSAVSDIIRLRKDTSTTSLSVQMDTTGHLRLRHGTGTYSSYTTDPVVIGTSYAMWIYYTASDGGNNGTAKIEFATSVSGKVGSGNKYQSLSGAPSTNLVEYLYLRGASDAFTVWDMERVDGDEIQNNP